jgi:hypothetical protein
MNIKYVDIIIIGSGIAGLYSSYIIKKTSPNITFLILEKYKSKWIGGRTNNDIFYNTEVVTGAGIGRSAKDKLLKQLLKDFNLNIKEYYIDPKYSVLIQQIDIIRTINILRNAYCKYKGGPITFKEFAINILGVEEYNKFILSAGYSDFENEDVLETLYYYGIEDNTCCWKAFHVPWKILIMKLAEFIGKEHFKFSNKVVKINKIEKNPCRFLVETEKKEIYLCNKVIIASTIDTIRQLLPNKYIYNDIEGQPFLRLYAKFSKNSIPIMKQYIKGFTFVPGPLQRIIPMNETNGVYMIAYNDNQNTLALKKYLKNTKENRIFYEKLLEKSLGIHKGSLHIIAIKDYYWPIGTHYYKPLDTNKYIDRDKFIKEAQHPEEGILVVGEAVSRNQGWTEGALESVKSVLNKKWVQSEC